jgi:Tfp pilus assembly protein PilZ
MDLRKEKRVIGNTKIEVRDGAKTYQVVLSDMSKKGLSIRTEHVLPCYKVIDLIIEINNNPIQVNGSVRWVNENIEKPEDGLNEMGILLINPPKEYLGYLKNLE